LVERVLKAKAQSSISSKKENLERERVPAGWEPWQELLPIGVSTACPKPPSRTFPKAPPSSFPADKTYQATGQPRDSRGFYFTGPKTELPLKANVPAEEGRLCERPGRRKE